jgi:hypothetical protein
MPVDGCRRHRLFAIPAREAAAAFQPELDAALGGLVAIGPPASGRRATVTRMIATLGLEAADFAAPARAFDRARPTSSAPAASTRRC